MEHVRRLFQMGNEYCVTFIPECPNGFGILLLGDGTDYVEGKTSSWEEHLGKRMLLTSFLESGYTVFTSNFYGKHWGSPKAYELSVLLYETVLRKEILNEKIHIYAEGIGALLAKKWMKLHPYFIRSVALIQPNFSLVEILNGEKKHKLYYKRILDEIKTAYDRELNIFEMLMEENEREAYKYPVPVKIWMSTKHTSSQNYIQRGTEMWVAQSSLQPDIKYYTEEIKYSLYSRITPYFHSYEKEI